MSINRTALIDAANTIGSLAQAWLLDETGGTTAGADVAGGQDLTHTNGPVVSASGVDYDGVDDHTTHADGLTTQGNKVPPITMVAFVRTLSSHQAGTIFSYDRFNANPPRYRIKIQADGTVRWLAEGTSIDEWGATGLSTLTEYMLMLRLTSDTSRDGRINKGTPEAGSTVDLAHSTIAGTRRIHTLAGNGRGSLEPALIHVDAAFKFDIALSNAQGDSLFDAAFGSGGHGPLLGDRRNRSVIAA